MDAQEWATRVLLQTGCQQARRLAAVDRGFPGALRRARPDDAEGPCRFGRARGRAARPHATGIGGAATPSVPARRHVCRYAPCVATSSSSRGGGFRSDVRIHQQLTTR